MSISGEAKHDIKAARQVRPPWWALVLVGVVSLPVFWLFDHFGSLDMSLPVADSIVALAFVLYVKRKAFKRLWFWVTMAAFALLHALVVWLIPWSGAWKPAVIAAAFVSVDICLMLWLLATVETLVGNAKSAQV